MADHLRGILWRRRGDPDQFVEDKKEDFNMDDLIQFGHSGDNDDDGNRTMIKTESLDEIQESHEGFDGNLKEKRCEISVNLISYGFYTLSADIVGEIKCSFTSEYIEIVTNYLWERRLKVKNDVQLPRFLIPVKKVKICKLDGDDQCQIDQLNLFVSSWESSSILKNFEMLGATRSLDEKKNSVLVVDSLKIKTSQKLSIYEHNQIKDLFGERFDFKLKSGTQLSVPASAAATTSSKINITPPPLSSKIVASEIPEIKGDEIIFLPTLSNLINRKTDTNTTTTTIQIICCSKIICGIYSLRHGQLYLMFESDGGIKLSLKTSMVSKATCVQIPMNFLINCKIYTNEINVEIWIKKEAFLNVQTALQESHATPIDFQGENLVKISYIAGSLKILRESKLKDILGEKLEIIKDTQIQKVISSTSSSTVPQCDKQKRRNTFDIDIEEIDMDIEDIDDMDEISVVPEKAMRKSNENLPRVLEEKSATSTISNFLFETTCSEVVCYGFFMVNFVDEECKLFISKDHLMLKFNFRGKEKVIQIENDQVLEFKIYDTKYIDILIPHTIMFMVKMDLVFIGKDVTNVGKSVSATNAKYLKIATNSRHLDQNICLFKTIYENRSQSVFYQDRILTHVPTSTELIECSHIKVFDKTLELNKDGIKMNLMFSSSNIEFRFSTSSFTYFSYNQKGRVDKVIHIPFDEVISCEFYGEKSLFATFEQISLIDLYLREDSVSVTVNKIRQQFLETCWPSQKSDSRLSFKILVKLSNPLSKEAVSIIRKSLSKKAYFASNTIMSLTSGLEVNPLSCGNSFFQANCNDIAFGEYILAQYKWNNSIILNIFRPNTILLLINTTNGSVQMCLESLEDLKFLKLIQNDNGSHQFIDITLNRCVKSLDPLFLRKMIICGAHLNKSTVSDCSIQMNVDNSIGKQRREVIASFLGHKFLFEEKKKPSPVLISKELPAQPNFIQPVIQSASTTGGVQNQNLTASASFQFSAATAPTINFQWPRPSIVQALYPQMSSIQVPHNQMPSNQVPHTQMPSVQVPYTQMSSGQVPHNQMPPAQVPSYIQTPPALSFEISCYQVIFGNFSLKQVNPWVPIILKISSEGITIISSNNSSSNVLYLSQRAQIFIPTIGFFSFQIYEEPFISVLPSSNSFVQIQLQFKNAGAQATEEENRDLRIKFYFDAFPIDVDLFRRILGNKLELIHSRPSDTDPLVFQAQPNPKPNRTAGTSVQSPNQYQHINHEGNISSRTRSAVAKAKSAEKQRQKAVQSRNHYQHRVRARSTVTKPVEKPKEKSNSTNKSGNCEVIVLSDEDDLECLGEFEKPPPNILAEITITSDDGSDSDSEEVSNDKSHLLKLELQDLEKQRGQILEKLGKLRVKLEENKNDHLQSIEKVRSKKRLEEIDKKISNLKCRDFLSNILKNPSLDNKQKKKLRKSVRVLIKGTITCEEFCKRLTYFDFTFHSGLLNFLKENLPQLRLDSNVNEITFDNSGKNAGPNTIINNSKQKQKKKKN